MKLNKITFRGNEGYVIDGRIASPDRRTDLYYYDLRHGDEDFSVPCTIENLVTINHWGTICFKQPITHLMNEWAEGRYEIELTEDEITELYSAIGDCYNGIKHEEI